MPFTPSHAVLALPFVRTPLVPAAIAVGAMTPDLPLFVRGLPLHYGLTHSLGWLPVTIATALALLVLWRTVLRPAARELAPTVLARRLPPEWDVGAPAALRESFAVTGSPARASWAGILWLVASLGLGVVTHIVWDLFTHEGRWGVQLVPGLDDRWGPLAGYTWLQHGSSVVGSVILAVWAAVWLRRRIKVAPPERLLPGAWRVAWWISLPVLLAAAWAIGLVVFGPLDASWTPAHLAYRVLPPACAVWGALTTALAVTIQVVRARRSALGDGSAPA